MSNKSLVEIAKSLRRANVPIKRNTGTNQEQGEPQPAVAPPRIVARPVLPAPKAPEPDPRPVEKESNEPMYGRVLDSWKPKYQPKTNVTEVNPNVSDVAVDVQPKPEVPFKRGRGRPKKVPEKIKVLASRAGEEGSSRQGMTFTIPSASEDDEYYVVRRKSKRPSKVRRENLSFSVSTEEADLIRAHVATLSITFSAWVRNMIFRSMGRKVPPRPEKR